MAGSIEELLELLYTEIEEAKNMPLNADKCVVDRDRVLDMIDDVKAEIPVEVKRAQDLVANRNDYIASAKREADEIREKAKDYAKELLNKESIVKEAEDHSNEIIAEAEERSKMLKQAAGEYCEDTLRKAEEAVAGIYDEIKRARAQFRSILGIAPETPQQHPQAARPQNARSQNARPQSPRRPMYDAEADEEIMD